MERRIAMNPNRNPNKGVVHCHPLEDYDRLTAQQWLKEMVDEIRGGREELKGQLPFRSAHYARFEGDRRKQQCMVPEAFLFQTTVDVDDARCVEQARDDALALNEQPGRWHHMLLHMDYSARNKLHIDLRMPIGMTIEETQRAYCEALGIPYDESCITPERIIYITDERQEIFRSEQWCAVMSDEERRERVEAYDRRNLTADGRPAAGWSAEAPIGPAGQREYAEGDLTYKGIPYAEIIGKWWQMYNDGETPVERNRDVLTFELAMAMRHICGFDFDLMNRVIPCYDRFPQEQKEKCIRQALGEKRTMMPRRLKDVLEVLRAEHADDACIVSAVDELQESDDLYYYNRLRPAALPMGIRDSIQAAGPRMAMPVLATVCPIIGMLATGVRVEIHGRETALNLMSFIVGEAASGKGNLDPIVQTWLEEVQRTDDMYLQQEREWRERKRKAKNTKEQPEEPKLPVRVLTLNNTVANIAERLSNTDGVHSFSFTPEADTVAQKWRTSMSDFSVMLRQAYDGTAYAREARSVDSVSVHIKNILWNVVMCGTQDALYRVVSNSTDGLLSRCYIAHTPDNTYTPLDTKPFLLNERRANHIRQVAHLLPLMRGTVVLERLERHSREWVEQVRLDAMKNDDRALARARMRDHVTAQRMTVCLMLCKAAEMLIKEHGLSGAEERLRENPELWKRMMQRMQTPSILEAFDVMADNALDNDMTYFRERLEQSISKNSRSVGERSRKSRNDSIYARLGSVFTREQAYQQAQAVKGTETSMNSVYQMLKNWKNQGLIETLDNKKYRKLRE